METYHLASAQDNLTGEYRQVGYMSVEDDASRMNQVWSMAFLVAVVAWAFIFLARKFGNLPAGFSIGPREILLGILIMAGTLVAQAWLSILLLRRFGAQPQFGLFRNNVIAYVSAAGYGLRRNSVILMALAPLALLLGLSLLGIWLSRGTAWVAVFALIAVTSAGASANNFWTIVNLLRYPSSAWTVDDEHGMRILLPLETK
jgi:hypothetical protein